jgi:mannose-6-phosphate isomerase
MLYPLFFKPISKEKLWGGRKLMNFLNKPFHGNKIGESWELSAVSGDESVVSYGPLKGKQLNELIEIYKADLVGKSVYERFGNDFPILIKYIDAQKNLSVQLHPHDHLSKVRNNPFGKNEMWYIIDADPGAQLITGFSKDTSNNIFKTVRSKTYFIMKPLKEVTRFLFAQEPYMRLELVFYSPKFNRLLMLHIEFLIGIEQIKTAIQENCIPNSLWM